MKIPEIKARDCMDSRIAKAPEAQLIDAMASSGLSFRGSAVMDGIIHRFSTDSREDETGWYVGFADPIPAGAYGDWRTGLKATWTGMSSSLSEMDREALRERLEKAKKESEEMRAKRAKLAAEQARKLWEDAKPCEDHPYLRLKGLSGSCGARLVGEMLAVPVRGSDGQICSLELISGEGRKRFLPGGTMKGGWFIAGDGIPEYSAEGFATAASIHEATGRSCLVTFCAGNIGAAIQSYRQACQGFRSLTIVADNDASRTGELEAEKARKETGCPVVLIPEQGMDANDYASSGHDLRALLIPERPYLEPADSYLVQQTPKRWLVKGWVPAGPALMMVFGQSGHGKTFFALDLMLSVATGQDSWCGCRVNPGSVIYLCGEGQQGVRERVAAWAQSHALGTLGDRMLISQGSSMLDTPDGYAKVSHAIADSGMKPDLIVVDTLNRFMAGDENDTRDASAFIAVCDRLETEHGCCVCLVHHIGVNEAAKNRARGSSAFLGALDIQIHVKKTGDIYSAGMTKNKDGKEEDPINFLMKEVKLDGWTDDDGEQLKSAVLEPTEDRVIQAVPAQQKKDEDMLLDAVAAIGSIPKDGGVTIARDRWISFLISRGRSRISAQRDLNEGQERKLISRLMEYGDVLPVQGGWRLVGQLESVARLDVSGRLFNEA